MDGPTNSSVRNKDSINIHVDDDHVSDEESGWTAILEEFSCSNNGSFISSHSLVSDAAWYGGPHNNISHVKRLSIKNLKRSDNNHRKYSCDVDLEDTASSPVNSPKISNLKQMEVNYPIIDDVAAAGNFLGKRAGSTSFTELIEMKEQNEKNVDLQKRGLCVVPMSTFIDYFG